MVKGSKTLKILLTDHGEYFGQKTDFMSGNEFFINDKDKKERAKFKVRQAGEVILGNGNLVSTTALCTLLENHADVSIVGFCGQPIGYLKALDDDSHVETRIMQYEALKNGKGICIAKQFVISKIEGQNNVLKKYGLRSDTSMKLKINALESDNLDLFRKRLLNVEGKFSQFYFKQILQLFPEKIRPEHRIGFKAYDGVNNLFNLAYEVLFWKCYSALIKSKVEPFLGFLHSLQFGKPSLVCDFQEFYRPLIDDFVIQFSRNLKIRDFKKFYILEHGKYPRLYLNHEQNVKFRKCIHDYFMSIVEIPRMKVGKRQKFETLICEEALLFAKYLRNEKTVWNPRIPSLSFE
jgi:CRISPR-associated protein Cas1